MLDRRQAGTLAEAAIVMREWSSTTTAEGFARLEIDLPAEASCALPLYPRVSWRSRSGDLEIQAWGAARQWDLSGWADEATVLEDLCVAARSELGRSLRWFLWGRFDAATRPAAEWRTFGSRRLLLPWIELRRENGRSFVACNRIPDRDADLGEALARMAEPRPATWGVARALPSIDRGQWSRQVEQVQQALAGRDDLQKVVLARTCGFAVPEFAPEAFLTAAAALQPDSYRFLVEPTAGTAFLGLSPERLFRRRGAEVVSEALAGTRPRGNSPEQDDALARELASAPKDRREQGLVLEQILDAFRPLVRELDHDAEPRLRRLREVQHLCSGVRAELLNSVRDGDLLAALHPTPAVAGHPARRARAVIAEVEEFDRGLYAGPVGCGSVDETDVAVAIRSALWHEGTLRLFAGAGLLPASSAPAEWDETEAKMGLLAGLLLNTAEGAAHEI